MREIIVLLILTILLITTISGCMDKEEAQPTTATPPTAIPIKEENTPTETSETTTTTTKTPTKTSTETETKIEPVEPTKTETPTQTQNEPVIKFYVFGLETCPHCMHLKANIIKAYGEKSLVFYNLNDKTTLEKCYNAFIELTYYTHNSGVPQAGIFKNGELKVVVLGDFSAYEDIKAKVDVYLSYVESVSRNYNTPHILIDSAQGAYYVNKTEDIVKLTQIFLHPESFKEQS